MKAAGRAVSRVTEIWREKTRKKEALTEADVENWCFKAADMRVVFDTNIYISAFAVPRGNAEEAYLKAIHGEFELFPSVATLTEAARVLQITFDWSEDRARHAIQEMSQTATVLRPRPTLHVLRDEPDNRILECAVAVQAYWIVSGDRHLLTLKRHAGSAIISLALFLAQLEKETSSP